MKDACLFYQFSLIHFYLNGWENVLFELGGSCSFQTTWKTTHLAVWQRAGLSPGLPSIATAHLSEGERKRNGHDDDNNNNNNSNNHHNKSTTVLGLPRARALAFFLPHEMPLPQWGQNDEPWTTMVEQRPCHATPTPFLPSQYSWGSVLIRREAECPLNHHPPQEILSWIPRVGR